MHFEIESVKSVRIIERRKVHIESIGENLETVQWDGRYWPEMRSFYLSGTQVAMMLIREQDNRCAVVSCSELLGNGYTEFGVQFF